MDIVSLGIKAALSLEMEGPLDMDIRLRRMGRLCFLEINARIGGNVLSATEILDSLVKSWEDNGMRIVGLVVFVLLFSATLLLRKSLNRLIMRQRN